MLFFSPDKALAEFGFELSRNLSATSSANQLGINHSFDQYKNEDDEVVWLMHYLQYDLSSSTSQVSLNSTLPDFEINSVSHQFGYDLTYNEALTMALNFGLTNFNNDEARQVWISLGGYYQLGDAQAGYVVSSADTFQLSQVRILGNNYRDSIRFNRRSNSFYLSYSVSKSFMTSLNYTQYSFDKNLDNSYALYTTTPFLTRSTGAVASEIASQISNSADLNFSFLVDRGWLLTLGLGASQEALSPNSVSNNVSLAVDYEFSRTKALYRIFAALDVAKTQDVEGTSSSGQFGFGMTF